MKTGLHKRLSPGCLALEETALAASGQWNPSLHLHQRDSGSGAWARPGGHRQLQPPCGVSTSAHAMCPDRRCKDTKPPPAMAGEETEGIYGGDTHERARTERRYNCGVRRLRSGQIPSVFNGLVWLTQPCEEM